MLKKQFLNRLCLWIIVLAILNQIATYFHWYNLLWWFDMPMHFLGGFTVFFFSAVVWLPARKWVRDYRFIYEAIITTLLVGVLWEALELYLYLNFGTPPFYTLDSLSDVAFDLAGSLFAAYCSIPLLRADRLAKENTSVVS